MRRDAHRFHKMVKHIFRISNSEAFQEEAKHIPEGQDPIDSV